MREVDGKVILQWTSLTQVVSSQGILGSHGWPRIHVNRSICLFSKALF